MIQLYISQVVLFSAFPLYFTFLKQPLRQVSFFICIALYLLIGGFFGNIYSMQIADGIIISGGNLCYGAFMMSAVLFVLVEKNIFILRNILRLLIFVDVFNAVFSILVFNVLTSGNVINPHNVSANLFSVSIPFIILGGFLIFVELFSLFFIFERLKKWNISVEAKGFLYVLLFIITLCADGILFPFIAFGVSQEVISIVIGGFVGKLIMAGSFAIPLVLFILFRSQFFKDYLSTEQFRWKLIVMSSDALMKDLIEKENRLNQAAAVFSHAHEGMALVDEHGVIMQANPAFMEMMSLSSKALVKTQIIDSFFSLGEKPFQFSAIEEPIWQGEVNFKTSNQNRHYGLLNINPIYSQNSENKSYIYSLINIDNLKEAQRKLEYLAMHDQLTGIPNRRLLEQQMQILGNISVTMIIIDIDHFKDINDSYGHAAGDYVLQEVSRRLNLIQNKYLSDMSLLCRTGGDEFAFVYPNSEKVSSDELIDQIKAAFQSKFIIPPGTEVYMSASIGISVHQQSLGKYEGDLLQEADTALYEAKRKQRGSSAYYQRVFTQINQRKFELANKMRTALSHGLIEVYFQPQIDAITKTTSGTEALVRWKDEHEGWISPAEFIPIAESTGLVETLGEYVLEQSCKQGRVWLDNGYDPIKISVNVSAVQLRFGLLPDVVRQVLEKTKFPASSLELELTESSLLERESEVHPQLLALRSLGVRLAIDDFGTGYSSLSYLYKLPFTTLKIDRSFVNGLSANETLNQLTTAIIALGKGMKMELVAEGVETTEQAMFLKQLGCDHFQGYLYSPAVPAREFTSWLNRTNTSLPD